jgi:HEAT repeat protein
LVEGAETAVAAPVPTPNPGSFAINGPPGEVIEFEPVSVDLATAPSLLVKRMEVVSGGASAGASADTASGVVNVTLDDHIEGVRVDLSYSTTDEGHGATLPPDPLPYDYLVQVTSSNPGPGAPWQFIVNGLSRSGSTFSASVGTNTSGLLDAAEFLAPVIAGLQEQLFPVDEATLAAIEQRVLDTSLAHVDRMREFGRLKRMSERAGRTQLSDDVALAGVDIFMSASNDWERQTLLTSLTGVDNAVVVQPLSNILRNDANEATRLQAALALTAFDQDVYARAALETAANVDPSAAVRQNARWGLLDAAGRRNLIIASLLDTRLSDAERIEPLLFQGNWLNEPPVQLGSAIDATLVNELTALLRREERESTRLSIVGNFTSSSNPALTPLFIELLAEDESVVIRRLAVEALGLRRDEPGVSSVIARAAAEDPSPIVRASAARAPDAGN